MKKQLILIALILTMALLMLVGCSSKVRTNQNSDEEVPVVGNLKYDYSMDIKYAENFSVDYYEGGYALISISNNTRFLVVPENMDVPEDLDEDIDVIQQPISNVYLVATAAMTFLDRKSVV